jgi:hypothetical protein
MRRPFDERRRRIEKRDAVQILVQCSKGILPETIRSSWAIYCSQMLFWGLEDEEDEA